MKKIWKKCEGTKKKLEKNMRVPKTKLETNLQYPKKCKICNTQKSAMFQLNYSDFRSIKKFWENSRFMKKNWKKNLGVPKKNWENLWQKLEKMWGTKNKTGDKSAIPKKVQILNVSNIVDKKVQILNVSNIVPPNIDKQIFGIKYSESNIETQILYTFLERYENFEYIPKCRTLEEWLRTLFSSCRKLKTKKVRTHLPPTTQIKKSPEWRVRS